MKRWTPVGAMSLIDRPTRFLGSAACEASLFPFFEHDGQVRMVMVLVPGREDLRVFCPAETPVRIPWFGPLQLGVQFDELLPLEIDPLSQTWHFDPAWKLRESPWSSLPETPELQRTNCCDKFQWTCPNIYFNGQLTRAVMAAKKCKNERTVVSYRAARLPAPPQLAARPPTARQPRLRWQLAPIWERPRSRHRTRSPISTR